MVAQVGYSGAGRSRGRVARCAVCTWHVEIRSAGFLVEPQNQGGGGFPGLDLKTGCSGRVDATGCVGPCYPCFAVFLLLGLRGIFVFLAFCLGL
jgi:hypothetical protein